MKKVILSITLILVLVGSGLSYFYQRNLERAVFIGSLPVTPSPHKNIPQK